VPLAVHYDLEGLVVVVAAVFTSCHALFRASPHAARKVREIPQAEWADHDARSSRSTQRLDRKIAHITPSLALAMEQHAQSSWPSSQRRACSPRECASKSWLRFASGPSAPRKSPGLAFATLWPSLAAPWQ
jgi:hypothetical protein